MPTSSELGEALGYAIGYVKYDCGWRFCLPFIREEALAYTRIKAHQKRQSILIETIV